MPVSRGFNASNVVEIVTRLVLLFLHSGEGKPLLCQDNPWQLLASSGRYRTNPSRATVFIIPIFRLPSRRWPRTSRRSGSTRDCRGDDHHELAGKSRPWTAPPQMPPKHFSKASGTIALWRSSRSTTREKSVRAPARYHITRQDGTERVISNPAWALRVTLDMRAQLGDRAEPDRPVRELGLDRAVCVKRICMPSTTPDLRIVAAPRGSSSGAVSGRRSCTDTACSAWRSSPSTGDAGSDSARLPARASAGQAASKFSRWDTGRAGFDRNRKSRREAFKASTAAPPPRSSAETFDSGGAASTRGGRG